MQNLGGEALLFPQQPKQQVLGADVLVRQALRLFRGVGQYALTFVAQGQIHGSRDLLPHSGMPFDLFPDRLDRSM